MKDEQITVQRLMIDDSMFVPTPTLLSDVLRVNFLVLLASLHCLTCIRKYSMSRHKQPPEYSSAQASADEFKHLGASSNNSTIFAEQFWVHSKCETLAVTKVILCYVFQQMMRLSKQKHVRNPRSLGSWASMVANLGPSLVRAGPGAGGWVLWAPLVDQKPEK